MSTGTELSALLKTFIHSDADFSAADLLLYLNLGQKRIIRDAPSVLRKKQATLAITSDSREYSLASDFYQMVSLWIKTVGIKLSPMAPGEFIEYVERMPSIPSGYPEGYIILGYDESQETPAWRIRFDRTPDTDYTVYYWYHYFPATITADATPLLSSMGFDELLLWSSAMIALQPKDPEGHKSARTNYLANLSEFRAYIPQSKDGILKWIDDMLESSRRKIQVVSGYDIATNLSDTANIALGDAMVGYKASNSSGLLTGAVARTVHDRFIDDNVNGYDFDIDPTGVADSTVGLQAAIDATPTNGILKLPRGTIAVSGQLTIPARAMTIEGFGSSTSDNNSTFIVASGTSYTVFVASMRFLLRGIIIQGDGGSYGEGATINGVSVTGTAAGDADSSIIDCTFSLLAQGLIITGRNVDVFDSMFIQCLQGIVVNEISGGSVMRGIRIMRNRFHSMGGSATAPTYYSITVNDVEAPGTTDNKQDQFIIEENMFDGLGGGLMYLENIRNLRVSGNHAYRTSMGMNGIYLKDCIAAQITDNYLFSYVSPNGLTAITVILVNSPTDSTPQTAHTLIQGNYILNWDEYGIYVDSQHVGIKNNYILGANYNTTGGQSAIGISATSDDIDIVCNTCDGQSYDASAATQTHGITVASGATNITVSSNTVRHSSGTDYDGCYQLQIANLDLYADQIILGTNSAEVGAIRLPNGSDGKIRWRNDANSADTSSVLYMRGAALANDATMDLGTLNAMIFIYEANSAVGAIYILRGGINATVEALDPGSAFTVTKDNASTTNIYYDTNKYYLQNKTGFARDYTLIVFGG